MESVQNKPQCITTTVAQIQNKTEGRIFFRRYSEKKATQTHLRLTGIANKNINNIRQQTVWIYTWKKNRNFSIDQQIKSVNTIRMNLVNV